MTGEKKKDIKAKAREEIKKLVKGVALEKFESYSSESEYKPFFTTLFSEKEIVIGSVIQSLYTSFGMSIYEQIAVILAKSAGFHAERQYELLGSIDTNTENLIANYWKKLKNELKDKKVSTSDKVKEAKMIRQSIKPGLAKKDGDSTVDVFIKKPDGTEMYIDITTVKNNKKGFESLKLKMLRWLALRMSTAKKGDKLKINTFIAIPYNPYHPDDYFENRWNAAILDKDMDVLVQEDFWNLVGNGTNVFNELLEIFKEVHDEITKEIDDFFNNL